MNGVAEDWIFLNSAPGTTAQVIQETLLWSQRNTASSPLKTVYPAMISVERETRMLLAQATMIIGLPPIKANLNCSLMYSASLVSLFGGRPRGLRQGCMARTRFVYSTYQMTMLAMEVNMTMNGWAVSTVDKHRSSSSVREAMLYRDPKLQIIPLQTTNLDQVREWGPPTLARELCSDLGHRRHRIDDVPVASIVVCCVPDVHHEGVCALFTSKRKIIPHPVC